MKIEHTKTILSILAGFIVLISTVIGVERYFAKTSAQNAIIETLDIGASDREVFEQEQKVRHWKNQSQYKKRWGKPSEEEQAIIDQEEERLEELKQRRQEKIDRYRQSK